jgi:hypothetical protein
MSRKLRFLIVLSSTAPVWTLGASVSVTRDPDCSPNACGSVIQQNGAPPAGTAATLLWYFNGIAYAQNPAGNWWSCNGTVCKMAAGDPRQ